MSIQQSLNQALYTSTIAAGLYTHSPQGKERAQLKNLEKRDEAIAKQLNVVDTKVGPEESVADPIYGKAFQEQVDIARQKYELRPNEESFKEYAELKESYEEWEQALKHSQEKRLKELRGQKEGKKMRKKLLQGTPEVSVNKTKINLGGNQ